MPVALKKASIVALIVIGCLLFLLSLLVFWVNAIVLDTDHYVQTVAQLAADPVIQQALSDRLTAALFDAGSFEQRTSQALPQQLSFLAPVLTDRMQGLVSRLIRDELASSRFQNHWAEANRAAHSAAVWILTGGGGVVSTEQGKVAVDLSALRADAAQRLEEQGIDAAAQRLAGSGSGQELVLFESPALAKAQGLISLLETLKWLLPVLSLAAFGGAVWLSWRRLFALSWVGLAIAITIGLVLLAAAWLRSSYLDSLGSDVPRDAAAAALDIILGSLKNTLRTAFAAGLLLAAGAYAAGPSEHAVKLRQLMYRGINRAGARVPSGRIGSWVAAYRNLLWIAGLVIALLVIVFAGQLTPLLLILTAVVLLAWVVLVGILAAA